MAECGKMIPQFIVFLLCFVLNLSHLLCREELVSRLDKLKLLRDINFGYTYDNHVCMCNYVQVHLKDINGWAS